MELAEFLGAYTDILMRIRRLAQAATVLPDRLIDPLNGALFEVPLIVRNVAGASDVQNELKALAMRRSEVKASREELTKALRSAINSTFRGQRSAGGTRGAGAASLPPPAAAVERTPARWISGEIDDHEPDEPLAAGETYTIAFGVDTVRRAKAVGEAQFNDASAFPEGVDAIELTVDLQSTDFDITPQIPTFKLGRTGKGKTKALFTIVPKHEGRATLIATIHKERNFVQRLTIEVSVGAADARPPRSESFSRVPSSVPGLKPREALIMMVPPFDGSRYLLTVRDTQGHKLAYLEASPEEIAAAITEARDAMLSVVQHTNDEGVDVFRIECVVGLLQPIEAQREQRLRVARRQHAA